MLAFVAGLATTASAETTLLAEWLLNGNAVSGTVPTKVEGEVLLEDKTFKVAITCSGILDGWVGENGLGFVSEVLTLGGVRVSAGLSGAGLLCGSASGCEKATEASPIEVWPSTAGWESLLILMENGVFLELVFGSGYEVLCLILGLMIEDECNASETGVLVENGTAPVGALTPAKSVAEPLATCKEGGANSAVKESITEAQVIPTGGGELTVSSEGAGR